MHIENKKSELLIPLLHSLQGNSMLNLDRTHATTIALIFAEINKRTHTWVSERKKTFPLVADLDSYLTSSVIVAHPSHTKNRSKFFQDISQIYSFQ